MDQPIGEFLRRWFDAHRLEQITAAYTVAFREAIVLTNEAKDLIDEGLTTP